MRLTAARIIGVTKTAPLAVDVAKALERESDENAVVEEMRALLLVGSRESLAAAEEYSQRATGKARLTFASWLARTSPERLVERLSEFVDLPGIEIVIDIASLAQPTVRGPLIRAFLARAPTNWRQVLPELFAAETLSTDIPVLLEALRFENQTVRQYTVWEIISRLARGHPVATPVLDAAALFEPAAPASSTTWESVGRELVARWHRKSKTTDQAAFYKAEGAAHSGDLWALRFFGLLTNAEFNAIREVEGREFTKIPAPSGPQNLPEDTDGPALMRTAPSLFPGFLASLLTASGCKVANDLAYAAARIVYDAVGRPVQASMDPSSSPDCKAALGGLIRVTVADDAQPIPPGTGEWIVLILNRDFIACNDSVKPGPRVPSDGPIGPIDKPRKTKDAPPIYPAVARAARLGGVTYMRAVIALNGCVRDAAITRSTGIVFDLAALQAVTQWRYTPTLLRGEPVEVVMTVTVNFTLQ